jgi:hypothetical protein
MCFAAASHISTLTRQGIRLVLSFVGSRSKLPKGRYLNTSTSQESMGFSLYGVKAKSDKGEQFRNNVWSWRPLARYVLENIDIPREQAHHWQYNDGVEVSDETALYIADTLDKLIIEGHTKRYEKQYTSALAALPDEVCSICKGAGVRSDIFGKRYCNG